MTPQGFARSSTPLPVACSGSLRRTLWEKICICCFISIGQKTAADLLRRYGTLDGVRRHEAELTPRQRASIAEADLDAYLAIATMRCDLPLERPADASLDPARAAAWCAEQGMTRLAARLAGAGDA